MSRIRRWALLAALGAAGVLPAGAEPVAVESAAPGRFALAPSGAHFVAADGRPVLWLADTWWFCPSALCAIDGSSATGIPSMFRALVDLRASQGFNVIQMAFLGGAPRGGAGVLGLYRGQSSAAARRDYWAEIRKYIRYANDKGLVAAIGLGFQRGLDDITTEQLLAAWRDAVEALGDLQVVWFIAGEYNVQSTPERVAKVAAVGAALREIDGGRHPVTVHQADWTRRELSVGDPDWLDFVMVQGGHRELPPASLYAPRRRADGGVKPVVESECRYEGIQGLAGAAVSADDTRMCMIRAIQAGAVGFSYGAHGLWYPVQSAGDQRFPDYGPARPWWEAMKFPGAEAVGRVRRFYEAIEWWKWESRPGAAWTAERGGDGGGPVTRVMGNDRWLVWFPRGLAPRALVNARDLPAGSRYTLAWIPGHLRDTAPRPAGALAADGRNTLLPDRPSAEDWFLLMEKIPPVCDDAGVLPAEPAAPCRPSLPPSADTSLPP